MGRSWTAADHHRNDNREACFYYDTDSVLEALEHDNYLNSHQRGTTSRGREKRCHEAAYSSAPACESDFDAYYYRLGSFLKAAFCVR